jgi:hypothetical protein
LPAGGEPLCDRIEIGIVARNDDNVEIAGNVVVRAFEG